jgi:hypothetical protein
MGKPLYIHDCPTCKWLGRYHYEGLHKRDVSDGADLYYHDGPSEVTVIARWSDEPADYGSGLDLAFLDEPNEYSEAWKRANHLGLVRPEVRAYYELRGAMRKAENIGSALLCAEIGCRERGENPEYMRRALDGWYDLKHAAEEAKHILYTKMHLEK